MDQAINEIEAAKVLDMAIQTLRNWRSQRKGPPYIKLGRAVRYDPADIKKYLEGHKINPERRGETDL